MVHRGDPDHARPDALARVVDSGGPDALAVCTPVCHTEPRLERPAGQEQDGGVPALRLRHDAPPGHLVAKGPRVHHDLELRAPPLFTL